MDHKLSSLPGTTRKQSPKDSRIQTPLQRRKRHLHKRRQLLGGLPHGICRTLQSRATTGRYLGSVVLGQPRRVHGHHAADAAAEHALPLCLGHLFTVVCSCGGFGGPFLLEEGSVGGVGVAEALEVIQVVFAP